jgi:hypothetical protein
MQGQLIAEGAGLVEQMMQRRLAEFQELSSRSCAEHSRTFADPKTHMQLKN